MKAFIAALLAPTTMLFAYAAVISHESADIPGKWLSVDTGMTLLNGVNVTILRRTGTEVVTCYGFGTSITRDASIPVIDDWCNNIAIGQFVPAGATLWARYNYPTFTIYLSALALTSCQGFTIDANCNRLLRLPLDGCNTDTVTAKQGGFETDTCGQWRFDPGSNGSDV